MNSTSCPNWWHWRHNKCLPFHILESLSIKRSTSEEFSPSGPCCSPTWQRILLRPSEKGPTVTRRKEHQTKRLMGTKNRDVPEYLMICPNQVRVFRAKHWWATTDECITWTLRGLACRLLFLWMGESQSLNEVICTVLRRLWWQKILTTMMDLACSQNWKSPNRTDFLPCDRT